MMIYVGNTPLGSNIRSMRKKIGISLKKLEEQADIPYWVLSDLENGIQKDITYS